ncbi:MAG: hypothetical protein ABSB54_10655 [Acidimicrobiales bacterium]
MGWLQRLLGREPLSAAQPGDARAGAEPPWEQLAPLGGTFAPSELTLQPAKFEAELTTRRSPGVIGPMLHDVSIDGLPGYVEAAVQPLRSAPPAEGTVRFPSPPPSLSRVGAASETPAALPETPPRTLPSLPPPPAEASLVDAGEVPLEVMQVRVHDDPAPPGLVDGTPPAATATPTGTPSSPAPAGTTLGAPGALQSAPSAPLVVGAPPSLPTAGASESRRGTPSAGVSPTPPASAAPAVQRAGPLPAAGGSPPGVRKPETGGTSATGAPLTQGEVAAPLRMARGATPSAAEPPAVSGQRPTEPTVQAPLTLRVETAAEPPLDPPRPADHVPAAAPRRVQRYRLGEPETLQEPAASPPPASGHSPAGASRPIASPPLSTQLRPAAAPPPAVGAAQPGPTGFAASRPPQASPARLPAAPGAVTPPPARSPAVGSPSRLPPAAPDVRPVAPPEPAPLTLATSRDEAVGGPPVGELTDTPSASPVTSPELELLPAPAAPLSTTASPWGLTRPLQPSLHEAPASPPARAILAQRQALRPTTPPSLSPGSSDQRGAGGRNEPPPSAGRAGQWAGERLAHPAGHELAGDLGRASRPPSEGLAPATEAPVLQATVINFPGPANGPAPASGDKPPPAAPLQRQLEPAAGSEPDLTVAEPPAPAPALSQAASAPAPAEAPPGRSDAELDELGRRLYDRIRDHLAAELSLDRERAGLLNDLGSR